MKLGGVSRGFSLLSSYAVEEVQTRPVSLAPPLLRVLSLSVSGKLNFSELDLSSPMY